jgi:hypothetical protein
MPGCVDKDRRMKVRKFRLIAGSILRWQLAWRVKCCRAACLRLEDGYVHLFNSAEAHGKTPSCAQSLFSVGSDHHSIIPQTRQVQQTFAGTSCLACSSRRDALHAARERWTLSTTIAWATACARGATFHGASQRRHSHLSALRKASLLVNRPFPVCAFESEPLGV